MQLKMITFRSRSVIRFPSILYKVTVSLKVKYNFSRVTLGLPLRLPLRQSSRVRGCSISAVYEYDPESLPQL